MLPWFWDRDLVQMQLIVASIIPDYISFLLSKVNSIILQLTAAPS
jgi:hypothetical protein